jgi:hypothetical protein
MSQTQEVKGVATIIYRNNGFTCVKYHQTDVVKFSPVEIILNSGGWQTATTKTRMNQASNQFGLGYCVFQKDFKWFVDFEGKTIDFEDGMTLLR